MVILTSASAVRGPYDFIPYVPMRVAANVGDSDIGLCRTRGLRESDARHLLSFPPNGDDCGGAGGDTRHAPKRVSFH